MDEQRAALTVVAEGREWRFAGADGIEIVVGRDPLAQVQVEDARVSRRHLVIRHGASGWEAHDPGSRNGTFRDGARFQRGPVKGALRLRLGNPVDGALVELLPSVAGSPVAAVTMQSNAQEPAQETPSDITQRGNIGAYSGIVPLPKTTVTIGRAANNDIVLDDLLVSRHHAALSGDRASGYVLEDLASQNGTFVNGQRVRRVQLSENDIVSIGRHQSAAGQRRAGDLRRYRRSLLRGGRADDADRQGDTAGQRLVLAG